MFQLFEYFIFLFMDSRLGCILRSLADSDAFQNGRYAEHNGLPKTLKKVA